MNRIFRLASVLTCLAAIHGHAATPEPYPSQPITLVVPYPAGGSVDAVARVVSIPLGKALGRPVVVENLGGGSGSIGAAKVARASADGYTLLLGTVNETVLAPMVNAAVKYKPNDLMPVAKLGESTFVLVGRKGMPARSTDELIEYARKHPGRLTYATSGIGSIQHLIMEDIQAKSGTSMLHVPYRGGSAQITDLLGGQVDLALVAPATIRDYLQTGNVQVYGTASLKRSELAGSIPTLNESKYLTGIDQGGWVGIFSPRGTPPEVAKRISSTLQGMLADQEVIKQLKLAQIVPATVAEQASFGDVVRDAQSRMRAIVSRLKLDRREGPQ
ncbi:Bug family tripartite tricarboxylate transporter substrate binding protein [Cupriavidus numazuensis]|uniref:Uncharacterized protein n=1 Tax=Cupriavidus numazuensis TaxID=221992 RepID=A0ABN7QAG8_9BURK|nr:tripartite tricarboxylate transporter substrate binding protein [Cupriavidus numazuensis]CAG2158884.1 hypothetical protein LMG26411_06272 [Cupriavidus numazuensis]